MNAIESLEKAMETTATQIAHYSSFDKTRSGVVVGRNDNNKYDIIIDGIKYTNIATINNLIIPIGNIVRVMLPTNNSSQMFIYGIQQNSGTWGVGGNLFIDGDEGLQRALYDLGWADTTHNIDIDSSYHGAWTPTDNVIDGYSVYTSKNSWHVKNEWDTTKITFSGFDNFRLYIRSYGENNFDYMLVSTLNNNYLASCTSTNEMRYVYSDTQYTKAHTRGKSSDTNYELVSFDNLNPTQSYYFYIIYQKDASTDSYDDRGYFYIAT